MTDHRKHGMGDGISTPRNFCEPFAQVLERWRVARKLSVREIASILHTASTTVEGWLYQGKVPDAHRKAEVLRILLINDLPPSRAMCRHLRRLHGLTWDASRTRWKLRLTINLGTKVVGKRICLDVKVADHEAAIRSKELVVAAFAKLGLQVRQGIKSRKAQSTISTIIEKVEIMDKSRKFNPEKQ